MGRDAGEMYASGGDKEQYVISGKALERTDIDAQEISRRYTFPVGLEKRRPSSMLASLGSGLDTVLSENIAIVPRPT